MTNCAIASDTFPRTTAKRFFNSAQTLGSGLRAVYPLVLAFQALVARGWRPCRCRSEGAFPVVGSR
jgi:hypothetical protein